MRNLPVPGLLAPEMARRFKAYARDKRGIATVEFALIAVPFFFLIFGLLEVCVIFIMSAVLEHGANEAARGVRTGQFQATGGGQLAFKNSVCAELFDLMSCGDKLTIDMQVFNNFAGAGSPSPIGADGNLNTTNFGFNPGQQNQIVVVRVFYEWDLIVPVLSAPLANMSNSRRLIQSTVAFRNEPF